jgi:lipopolysaccharide export system permease protein
MIARPGVINRPIGMFGKQFPKRNASEIDGITTRRSLSRTLFGYIITETFFSFLVAFLFFFFIFFVNQLLLIAEDILSKHVPFQQVALLILYALPSIVAISAPFASLVGTLMTVGRLASDNEVLVMLSAGLSYATIFIPALLVGIGISLASFFANDVLLPAGTIQYRKLYRRIAVSTPALELGAHSVKRFKDTVIITGDVNGNSIGDLFILDRTGDGERRVIMAQSAELKDAGTRGLSLDLNGAFIQSSKEISREDYDYASSELLRYWVAQEDMIEGSTTTSPREMSSPDVRREIKQKEAALAIRLNNRYNRVLNQALALEESLRKGPDNAAWNRLPNNLAGFAREVTTSASIKKDHSLLNHWIEYYKKFTLPFGALAFVFLAVPLGLFAKKSGQALGFFFGILIAFLYWSFMIVGQTMGVRLNYSPFWTMWLPDILAFSIGLILCIVRMSK